VLSTEDRPQAAAAWPSEARTSQARSTLPKAVGTEPTEDWAAIKNQRLGSQATNDTVLDVGEEPIGAPPHNDVLGLNEKRVRAEDPDYVVRNRAAWQHWARMYEDAGLQAWRDGQLRWGVWGIPESELQLLADLRPGQRVIELGCGTAVVSGCLARQGIRPVAVDIAPAQLDTVRELQRDFGLSFPLICANAEEVPLNSATFDAAISDYGASLWCDPQLWIAEANRLLLPGGRLIFFTNGAMLMTCSPAEGGVAEHRLLRDYFAPSRVEFDKDGAVEFHPTHGEWIRLLRSNGFVLEDLIEVRPPAGAKPAFEFVTLEWAQRWPSEEIWVARKVDTSEQYMRRAPGRMSSPSTLSAFRAKRDKIREVEAEVVRPRDSRS
jgi:SAM-dependent methyltransferase